MYLEELPWNCGIAVLCDFSPATSVENIKEELERAKRDKYRFVIATLNDLQHTNLSPKLKQAGFKQVRKGINPLHESTIYIYIKDLGLFKDRRRYVNY